MGGINRQYGGSGVDLGADEIALLAGYWCPVFNWLHPKGHNGLRVQYILLPGVVCSGNGCGR